MKYVIVFLAGAMAPFIVAYVVMLIQEHTRRDDDEA